MKSEDNTQTITLPKAIILIVHERKKNKEWIHYQNKDKQIFVSGKEKENLTHAKVCEYIPTDRDKGLGMHKLRKSLSRAHNITLSWIWQNHFITL